MRKTTKYVAFCPKCHSTEIGFEDGVISICKNCGYYGAPGTFPEIEETGLKQIKKELEKSEFVTKKIRR